MKFKFKSIKQENKTNAKWKSERVFWEFQMRLINIETRFHWKIVFWHVAAGFITSVLHSTHTHTHTHIHTHRHTQICIFTYKHTHTLTHFGRVTQWSALILSANQLHPANLFLFFSSSIFGFLFRWFVDLFGCSYSSYCYYSDYCYWRYDLDTRRLWIFKSHPVVIASFLFPSAVVYGVICWLFLSLPPFPLPFDAGVGDTGKCCRIDIPRTA